MSRQLASDDGAGVANSERWALAELLTRPWKLLDPRLKGGWTVWHAV